MPSDSVFKRCQFWQLYHLHNCILRLFAVKTESAFLTADIILSFVAPRTRPKQRWQTGDSYFRNISGIFQGEWHREIPMWSQSQRQKGKHRHILRAHCSLRQIWGLCSQEVAANTPKRAQQQGFVICLQRPAAVASSSMVPGTARAHWPSEPPPHTCRAFRDFRPPRAWCRLCSCFTQLALETSCSLRVEMEV